MVLTADEIYRRVENAPLKGVGDYFDLSFGSMGTVCQVVFAARSHAQAREFKHALLRWVAEFEARYSRFIESSLVSRINREAGGDWVEIDAQTEQLFALCDWYHWTTEGVFDPTAAPLFLPWDYHRRPTALPSDDEVRRARGLVGWLRVERRKGAVRLPERGMMIDLGGLGKEYAVDEVTQLGIRTGILNLLVNFGNDLRVHGEPPERGAWKIGLENPDAPGRCGDGVALRDGAVCSSGDYLRYVEIEGRRYGHIIDPRTGYPVNNGSRAATVVAGSCTEAGVLATASFILGWEAGLDLISRFPAAEGRLWTDKGLFETRRFRRHVISS